MVAEILIMQQLLGHKKDAILVVPYVAIVQEKVGRYYFVGNTVSLILLFLSAVEGWAKP